MAFTDDLQGFTVGVTADRRGEEQALMLRRLGLEVMHAPAIRTLPAADADRLRAATEALIADPPDVLVANTGLGVRSWLELAATWGLADALAQALAATRIACRGPKAAGAVRSAGLPVWWRSPTEQLSDVGDHLVDGGVAGLRIAFQLHGDHSYSLTERLGAAGAEVVELPVYRWAHPESGDDVDTLIELCCAGAIDAVTFTAGPAVRNLFEVAEVGGRAEELRGAFNDAGVVAACVGPVCAAVAEEEGIDAPLVPEHWRLGSLVRVVGEQLAARRRRLDAGGVEVVLQGSVVLIDGEPQRLDRAGRALLHLLTEEPGAPVADEVLERGIDWAPETLATAIGALQLSLKGAGSALGPVAPGAHRFAAESLPETPVG